MIFNLEFAPRFIDQFSRLSPQEKRIVDNKVNLIKFNPYRFKSINSKRFSKVFRVRLKIRQKETRLIYVILEPKIVLVCLLERKNDYADLEHYLGEI